MNTLYLSTIDVDVLLLSSNLKESRGKNKHMFHVGILAAEATRCRHKKQIFPMLKLLLLKDTLLIAFW